MADDFFPGASTGNPAGFIVGKINDDIGPTQSLADYRDAGGSIRTENWFRLYAEVGDSLARQETAAGLDPFSIPGPNDYATWTMGNGGEFVTTVNVFFRDPDTGLMGQKQFMYKTDYAHTPAEAESAAWDVFADPDNETEYEQIAMGTSVRNVYQTVAF